MPILEVKVPNSLKEVITHSCPHSDRNAGVKTATRETAYGTSCKNCGFANPPLIDANGKQVGDKDYDEKSARNWTSQMMTSTRLKDLQAQYPFATFEVIP